MLNEAQHMLFEILRPIWLKEAEETGKPRYICRQRFLIKLGDKIGYEGRGILQFENMTNEHISKAIEVYEGELKKT